MGTEHFPLLKKTELKVSSRVVTKLAGRILKLLWITCFIQNTNKTKKDRVTSASNKHALCNKAFLKPK